MLRSRAQSYLDTILVLEGRDFLSEDDADVLASARFNLLAWLRDTTSAPVELNDLDHALGLDPADSINLQDLAMLDPSRRLRGSRLRRDNELSCIKRLLADVRDHLQGRKREASSSAAFSA